MTYMLIITRQIFNYYCDETHCFRDIPNVEKNLETPKVTWPWPQISLYLDLQRHPTLTSKVSWPPGSLDLDFKVTRSWPYGHWTMISRSLTMNIAYCCSWIPWILSLGILTLTSRIVTLRSTSMSLRFPIVFPWEYSQVGWGPNNFSHPTGCRNLY